ncbi:feruloyl CoA ortho-hydroxylase 2-like isoform X2 [Tasmannia lanceolata]|uniref:feruloyl CoA ortho-hydroxylase 2-like isoform X2 n=1 Tax=Tasmannia lanceolata TaxID=3420 RepID=UPI00406322A7
MADAIVSILLENLNSLILKEVKLLRGVKDDLEELQRNLSMIRAILSNAEAMAVENEQLKVWLSNLMDAAYDADDILSDWAVEAQDDVGGLEVKRKTDGEWIRVKPIPDAYIINVGTIIQVWSNDKYESPEHRVVGNSERERFSIPFFLNPADYLMVKPLEELVDEQNPPKYREYNCGEYFKSRKNSNFKNLGVENLQISHFKI